MKLHTGGLVGVDHGKYTALQRWTPRLLSLFAIHIPTQRLRLTVLKEWALGVSKYSSTRIITENTEKAPMSRPILGGQKHVD